MTTASSKTPLPSLVGAAAFGLTLVLATAGPVQAQQTINACYVPDVGAIYLIGLPGLPTECLSATHQSISWTEGGGSLADGSVTAIKLADGAVITVKLADAAVTTAKLAFDPATQAELDTHAGSADHDGRYFTETELSAAGTINTAGNPVDWSRLKGVPADFADGVDDGGGIASDIDCAGCVDSPDLAADAVTSAKIAPGAVTSTEIAADAVTSAGIADGAVAAADLAFDPATQGELDTHAGSADHDGRYFTETELSVAGTINTAGNPVDWTRLKGVPADFADGVDDGGGIASDIDCAGCVGNPDLADDAVTAAKIATDAVTATEIAASAVGTAEIATDAVTATEIAAGAVESAEIANGTVTTTDLAFDPATQVELDELSVAGTINTAGNPVDWTKLKGVPGGFADGVDDSGGIASDIDCVGCVGSADLAAGAVTAGKIAAGAVGTAEIVDASVTTGDLAFNPATQTELDTHTTSADHDGRYFTETELSVAGTINTVGNPVDWTRLKGVPADFADGVDDGTGTVTSIATGLGLTGGPITTSGTINVLFAGPGSETTVARSDHDHSLASFSTNTAIGEQALVAPTVGGNTAVGRSALSATTGGGLNTAVGLNAMEANLGGSNNTAAGANALLNNTAGLQNTAVGSSALLANGAGNSNTAVGVRALDANTGGGNTGVGLDAIGANTSGQFNTALGLGALQTVDGGSGNIGVGYLAGQGVTNGNNNIYIGSQGSGADNGVIRLGSSDQTETYISGILGQTASSGIPVLVGTGGQLGTSTSSIRFKEDVADLGEVSRRLLQLRPVRFHYRPEYDDGSRLIQYGLIAEEVEQVFPELVVYGSDGRVQTVRYHLLSVLLLNELQRQQADLEELKALRADVEVLAEELADLRRAVADAPGRD